MITTLLTFKDIHLNYPALERPILQKINYSVQAGDFVIVLGANGSGKSSLLKLIDGRYQPSQGQILLEHKNIHRLSAKNRAHHIHTLTQSAQDNLFLNLTLFENYQLLARNPKERKKKGLEAEIIFLKEYLKDFNPNLCDKLSMLVGRLSGGEQQALALALAVLDPPAILLLDEHTSALDPKTAAHLMALTANIIAQKKITALLTTHNTQHALNYGTRILALREGEILDCIEGKAKKELDHASLLERCY